RAAFADFEIASVAVFTDEDRERLLADAGIIRNRAKIDATIANARVLAEWSPGELDELIWSHAPDPTTRPVPRTLSDVPPVTPESTALSKALKKRGLRFVGPTTAYALMQACGLVDDHLQACVARSTP
ncbi:DNA-3-methyladenine glycosylase I, partial [Streptomyces cellulosae]